MFALLYGEGCDCIIVFVGIDTERGVCKLFLTVNVANHGIDRGAELERTIINHARPERAARLFQRISSVVRPKVADFEHCGTCAVIFPLSVRHTEMRSVRALEIHYRRGFSRIYFMDIVEAFAVYAYGVSEFVIADLGENDFAVSRNGEIAFAELAEGNGCRAVYVIREGNGRSGKLFARDRNELRIVGRYRYAFGSNVFFKRSTVQSHARANRVSAFRLENKFGGVVGEFDIFKIYIAHLKRNAYFIIRLGGSDRGFF